MIIQYLRNLRLDSISFWSGFIAATLLWWLLRILRPYLGQAWEKLKQGIQSARQGLMTTAEQRHRVDTLKYVQGLHLASPLFSLDEILVTPRLMAPPPLIDPDEAPPYETIISTLIPYAPDWPEMATNYQSHTLDVFEVLSGGMNIAIIGNPGIGKTTTLAYIATKLARGELVEGDYQEFLPVFVHVADLEFPEQDLNDPLTVVINAVSLRASKLALPRLPEMLRTSFETGKVFFLLDGLDECAPEQMYESVKFLESLMSEFPLARVVVSASVNHYDGLPALGFIPIPVASWGQAEQVKFVEQWGDLWMKFIFDESEENDTTSISPLLLNSWLLNLEPVTNPLDFSLKIWAAYAGDVRGPQGVDAIDAYIRRLIVDTPNARIPLEKLASYIILNMDSAITESQARSWLSDGEFEDDETESSTEISENEGEATRRINLSRLLPTLTQNGLLVTRSNGKFGFTHPVIAAYLAGSALAKRGESDIFSQPSWPLKDITTVYMAAFTDFSHQIRNMLDSTDDPLIRDRMLLGRWLQTIPQDAPGRKLILQQLTKDLQNESLCMSLRIRVLSALATSRDPGVVTLFRHLLNAQQQSVRQLAILGCGYLRDASSVKDLVHILGDSLNIAQAACFALVNIGTRPTLEAVASVLMQGDEQLKRAAAEAFATHPKEGYPILEDGSKVDDLLVRRAVIYGLGRVNQPWATQILEALQVEDSQWVVKDAAVHMVKQLHDPHPSIPKPQPPLEDLPWLVAFASDREVGISEGDSARNMLLRSLREGSDDEKLAALGQIQFRGEVGIFPDVYHLLYGSNPELKENAFHTIWHTGSMGVEIPPPIQFGLG